MISLKKIVILTFFVSFLGAAFAAPQNEADPKTQASKQTKKKAPAKATVNLDSILISFQDSIKLQQKKEFEKFKSEINEQLYNDKANSNKDEPSHIALIALIALAFAIVSVLFLFLFTIIYNKKEASRKKELEDLNAKQKEIEDNMALLSEKINEIEGTEGSIVKHLNDIDNCLKSTQNTQQVQQTTSMHFSKTQTQKQGEKNPNNQKPKTETLYAQARSQNGIIVLTAFGPEKKSVLPFLLTVSGDNCKVSFNNDAIENTKTSIETKLTPYADCKVTATGIPSTIKTLQPGKAVLQGKLWKMEVKPQLEIL